MKIPSEAKRVFQGEIFDVYQWEQKMFDGSTETFEMLKRPDTVQVIPVVGNKIFLTYEEQPRHKRGVGLFGGRVDDGEEPLAAAKRELLEEAGLASEDWELWRRYEPYHKIEWTVYYFIARNCVKTREPKLDAGEKIDVRPVSFEEFVKFVAGPEIHAGEFSADILRLAAAEKLDELKNKLWA